MTFQEYQQQTATTAVYPKDQGITYCALKLTSEAGEVAGAIGKWIRNQAITDVNDLKYVKHRKDVHTAAGMIADEIGDVLWYCSQLAAELDLDLEYIARANLLKLEQRKKDGELKERKKDDSNHCVKCGKDISNKLHYGFGNGRGQKFVCEDCWKYYNEASERAMRPVPFLTEEDLKLSTQQITRFCSICNKPIFDHDTMVTVQKGNNIDKQFHVACWIKNNAPQI